jgi:predicted AAA+ superfamily ATPase
LLLQQGLTESLAGRFESTYLPHWSFTEMNTAFGMTLDQYIWFGGYPGAATLLQDELRWKSYVLTSLIESSISRDILMLTRIDKPALMRRLFELGCLHSGQILSYNKMIGQLQDAGNTTTLAHYLSLLDQAGLLAGLEKFFHPP